MHWETRKFEPLNSLQYPLYGQGLEPNVQHPPRAICTRAFERENCPVGRCKGRGDRRGTPRWRQAGPELPTPRAPAPWPLPALWLWGRFPSLSLFLPP